MPIIVVEVMPKAELLDPQGKAVAGALARQGSRFDDVRIGKRFELAFEGPADDAALADARRLAEDMLSNSVIEDVVGVHYGVASGGSWQAYSPLGTAVGSSGAASARSSSASTAPSSSLSSASTDSSSSTSSSTAVHGSDESGASL